MSERTPSRDEALEALDFIVNILKEHEKDLDRLIGELGTIAGQLGETGKLSGKVDKLEATITSLQNEIGTVIKYLSTSPREAPAATTKELKEAAQASVINGSPMIVQCKQWEDFQTMAFQAQTVSFMYKEAEKTFEADALKNNQVITYSGEIPKLTSLLKMWLSKQLDISEKKVLEGVLALG